MSVAAIADLDPVAWALSTLAGSSDVVGAFGGADHVSGLPEQPWPHLEVADAAAGDDRNLWSIDTAITLAAWADPAGHPTGRAGLRKLCYIAVATLIGAARAPYTGGPVVVAAESTRAVSWSPISTTGQQRYLSVITVRAHPEV